MTTSKATKNSSSSSESSFDPRLIWISICRSWYWAGPLGLVLAGLAAFWVIQNFVPQYRASCILGVNKVSRFKGQGLLDAPRNLAQTESLIIKNDVVTRSVLTNPACVSYEELSDPETAERNLVANIKVVAAGADDRMVISFVGSDPEKVKVICNALADSYLRYREITNNRSVETFSNWLKQEIIQNMAEVTSLRELAKELNGGNPTGGLRENVFENIMNDSQLNHISKLKMQIVTLEQEVKIGHAKLEAAHDFAKIELEELEKKFGPDGNSLVSEISEQEILMRVSNDVELTRAKSEQRARQFAIERIPPVNLGKIRAARQKLLAADRAVQSETKLARERAIAAIQYFARQKQQSRDALGGSKKSNLYDQARNKIKATLSSAKTAQEHLEVRLAILVSEYEEERAIIQRNADEDLELQFAIDDYQRSREVLEGLKAHEGLARANSQSAVISIAPATLPRTPIEELPYKKLILACLAGLGAPFTLGLLLELRSQRLTNAAMCDRNGLSVIGEVARLPAGQRSIKGKRIFEESVDALRSNLFLSLETEQTRSIAVVSSMSGEGKSCVSSQIALSIAKATGKTVLLVDCDLRCPDQHDIFGLEMGPGITSVLAGKVKFKDAVDKSLGELVHVLPAGMLSTSPHRLVTRQSMAKFVEKALTEYEYVVIDTAPVLSAGESLAVASAVDATLLCVMRDFSRVDHVRRTTRRLDAAGVNVAGTIFSGISAQGYAYRYGDYDYSAGLTVEQTDKVI